MEIRPLLAAPVTLRALAALAIVSALGACATSDAIDPGTVDDGFGGRDAGGGANEAGPEGAGGYGGASHSSSTSGPGPGSGGGIDGDDQSSSATGIPDACGDGSCETEETCETCPDDCGACETDICGDGTCDGTQGETCDTCAADCGTCAVCGDAVCDEPVEDCEICFEDCGVCACEPDGLEPNGGSPTAVPLVIGVEVTGLSICAADFDWFSFAVNGTRTVTIRFLQVQGDLELEIFSQATGNYVTGSYSADDDEQVVLNVTPGTYWARVYGAGAENPSYSILVE